MHSKSFCSRILATLIISISLLSTGITAYAENIIIVPESEFENVDDAGIEIISESEIETELESEIDNFDATEPTTLSAQAVSAFRDMCDSEDIYAVIYLTDSYDVTSSPSYAGEHIASLPSGQTVRLIDIAADESNRLWFKAVYYIDEAEYTGFFDSYYLAYSNENLLNWINEYAPGSDPLVGASDNSDIYAFPKSYQSSLLALRAGHPNWTFVRMDTGLDWNDAIRNELGDKSLISAASDSSWRTNPYGAGWYYASDSILKYYMDPRNFLNEKGIFQFEQLTYNESYHSADAVQILLQNTFMAGEIPNEGMTYAQAFTYIGSSLKVSPFHLACRVYQEQGKGTSDLISGTYPGYEGLYNYFNVGASGATVKRIVESGLAKAREYGWTSRFQSLYGGANLISKNYIAKGQDTLYLQKFNVGGGYYKVYTHQYMQNIQAANSESYKLHSAYSNADALNSPFVFKIPVYENRPAKAWPRPPYDTAPDSTPEDDNGNNSGNNGGNNNNGNTGGNNGGNNNVNPKLTFTDVKANAWYYPYVQYAYENGIMSGFDATTFAPNEHVTRGQFATIIYALVNKPSVTYTGRFSDVPAKKYYALPIEWCVKNGLLSGYPDGTFKPEMNIERQQVAIILYNYAIYKDMDISAEASLDQYVDLDHVANYATTAMKWAVGAKIISGSQVDGSRYLKPEYGATRAECATMLYQFLSKK